MLITIAILVFFNRNSQPVTETTPSTFVSNSEEQLKEVEEINKKIEETELTKKIINGLTENGFSPDKRIQYTIYSPEKKVLTISLSNFDREDKTINKIIDIINTITKENNLNTFSVELSETIKE
ncbi:hypothetical protein [Lysinibacillus xylanilyticus]|uniref:hypothetical protein n=1 Tax=Lysinibacillus xylanilyticus TaxID=582475 RepID=UPI003D021DAF